jgi:hypothetical protein
MAGAHSNTRRLHGAREEQTAEERAVRRLRAGARLERAVELAPSGVGRCLDSAFQVYSARFAYCILVTLAIWIPVQLASEALLQASARYGAAPPLLILLLPIPVRVLTISLLCTVASQVLLGEPVRVRLGLLRVLSRAPQLLALSLLMSLAAIPLACMCLFPMYVGFWLASLAPVILVLEGGGIGAAVRRSVELVWGWGFFARWIGLSLVTGLLFLPANFLAGLLEDPRTRSFFQTQLSATGEAFELLMAFLSSVFLALSTAFIAVLVTVYYLDTRARKEALDVELELARLVARRTPGGPQVLA